MCSWSTYTTPGCLGPGAQLWMKTGLDSCCPGGVNSRVAFSDTLTTFKDTCPDLVSRTPGTQSSHSPAPSAHPHTRRPCECTEQVCTQARGRGVLGAGAGGWGLHVDVCRGPGWPPPSTRPLSTSPPAPTLMVPSTPCSCCLILLNTESQPHVNWFYSSLLCLSLSEEMPPIKF